MNLAIALLTALFLAALNAAAALRPNILFIYADDQSYDALSVVQKTKTPKGVSRGC